MQECEIGYISQLDKSLKTHEAELERLDRSSEIDELKWFHDNGIESVREFIKTSVKELVAYDRGGGISQTICFKMKQNGQKLVQSIEMYMANVVKGVSRGILVGKFPRIGGAHIASTFANRPQFMLLQCCQLLRCI